MPGNIPDKSGDEFEDDEDQEVDGLFFDEFSPDRMNSGLPSAFGAGGMNQDIEDSGIKPILKAQLPSSSAEAKLSEGNSLTTAYPLDAMNVQALMENPALTQHLINVLTENLEKAETKDLQQSQATPVFSYQEIMKKQLMNDKSNVKPVEAKKLMPDL